MSWFHGILSLFSLVLYIAVWVVGLVGVITIFTRYSKPLNKSRTLSTSTPTSTPTFPGVTILRPLKGLDAQLEECLKSAFQQNYPQFEILLSVADEHDPAIKVAKELIKKYPNVVAKLIVGAQDIGPNPKINNLIRSYSAAKFDIIWILDANTYVPPNTLRHSIDVFLEACHTIRPIQLIHHLPLCVISHPTEKVGWGALLEEVYLSTSHAKFYVSINRFRIAPCVMGKSNLFRKSSLDRATSDRGLARFAQFIAEDHLIADTLWYQTPNPGPNHAMTEDVARQPVQNETLGTYFERRIRWIRVRKYMVTSATLIEPFTECFLSGFIGSFSLNSLLGFEFMTVYLAHTLIWLSLDFIQFYTLHSNAAVESVQDGETPEFARGERAWNLKSLGMWLVCWFVREVTCFPLWIVAMCGRSVVKWRNRKFVVRSDMTVSEIK